MVCGMVGGKGGEGLTRNGEVVRLDRFADRRSVGVED
jgi:hypothetical protein